MSTTFAGFTFNPITWSGLQSSGVDERCKGLGCLRIRIWCYCYFCIEGSVHLCTNSFRCHEALCLVSKIRV